MRKGFWTKATALLACFVFGFFATTAIATDNTAKEKWDNALTNHSQQVMTELEEKGMLDQKLNIFTFCKFHLIATETAMSDKLSADFAEYLASIGEVPPDKVSDTAMHLDATLAANGLMLYQITADEPEFWKLMKESPDTEKTLTAMVLDSLNENNKVLFEKGDLTVSQMVKNQPELLSPFKL